MARQASGPLREITRTGADRERLFAALLDELARPGAPAIAVFEDVHWADEATLDLLKFVARRIRRTTALAVLTFRDDEVAASHPLHRLLGELPPASVHRIALPPLSESAVTRLAAVSGRAGREVHRATGGNPFYVTEVLATAGRGIPASVRDAVLARGARLSADARAVLDVVSVVPGAAERWLVEELAGSRAAAAEECARAGLLRSAHDTVSFRHELARQAWEGALDPVHAAALHGRMLAAMQERRAAMLPRLVYHAHRSGDAATVLRLAPAAAREAAALGAHREAAAHYESALRYATGADPAERAALLDAWSYEAHLGGRIAEAVRAREEALALWREVKDARREGDTLRWLSRLAWFEGRRDDAATYADAAIRVLEPLGAGHELAMAYSARAQLHILAEERHLAPAWGDRAIAMAEALGDTEALVHALTNAACLEPGSSRQMQVRAVRLAQEHGMHEHAMRAYAWLISDAVTEQEYPLAEGFLEEALAYAEDRDLDAFALYLRGWRARMRAEQGRLEEAAAEAAEVLRRENTSAVVRLPSLTALGTVLARRGEPGAGEILDEALALARATGELQRLAPVACARAEAAWLANDAAGVRAEVMHAYRLAQRAGSRWDVARLETWLRRAGALDAPAGDAPGPFAASRQRPASSAAAWQAAGCPYERALALADGDEAAQREAVALLDALGARPAAALVRSRLASRGVRGVPRGPRPSTRANPAGLTNREVEVLSLLAEGLSNREIARRLFLSTRTVDHHVSALLRKLDAGTRMRAARMARELGLV
jgi:DNA-binding CsgD family transcriptional regulator